MTLRVAIAGVVIAAASTGISWFQWDLMRKQMEDAANDDLRAGRPRSGRGCPSWWSASPSIATSPMDYYAHSKNAAPLFAKLASFEPQTLAVMHGSAWRGDGATLLRELARAVEA